MQYFESDVPGGNGLCSDNSCPCSEVNIPRGEGYIYIDKELVDFRRKFPSLSQARQEMQDAHRNRGAMFGPSTAFYRLGPILVCEEGAKLRKLDLRVAAEDVKRWWNTGQVPLRPTPIKTAETRVFKGHSIEEAKVLAKKEIPEKEIDKIEVLSDVEEKKNSSCRAVNAELAKKILKKTIPADAFDLADITVEGTEQQGEVDIKLRQDTNRLLYSWKVHVPDSVPKNAVDRAQKRIATCKKILGFVIKPAIHRISWYVPVFARISSYKLPAEIEVYLKPKKK